MGSYSQSSVPFFVFDHIDGKFVNESTFVDCSSCLALNLLVSGTTQGGGVDDGDHQAGGGGALDGGWHHQATPQLPCAHHLLLARAAWKWAMIRLVTIGNSW